MYYFFAIPQLFGSSPWLVGGFCAVLSTLLMLWTYRIMKRQVSQRAALLALSLLAFGPWVVLYSDRAWGGCVLLLLGAVALLLAMRLEKPWAQGALVFVCIVAPGIHLQAPMLWASLVPLVVCAPKFRLSWRAILLGTVLAIATYSSAIYEEIETDFANTRAIMEHATGEATEEESSSTPAKAAAYLAIFASAEITFQLEQGFFGASDFDEGDAYLTREGWEHALERDGRWFLGATLASVALALLGWLAALVVLGADVRRAIAARTRVLPARSRMTAAVLLGVGASAFLMTYSNKPFYPHYLLMSIALVPWPVAVGLDAIVGKRTRRTRFIAPVAAALALLSATTMAVNTVRFYREVDGLNGMNSIVTMVGEVLEGPQPIAVRFRGRQPLPSWQRVAATHYGRPLPIRAPAAVIYTVQNDTAHWNDPLPESASRHGAVFLVADVR
jgi:hypothetical protein